MFIVVYKPAGVTKALSTYQLSFYANLNIMFHEWKYLGSL